MADDSNTTAEDTNVHYGQQFSVAESLHKAILLIMALVSFRFVSLLKVLNKLVLFLFF